MAFNNTVITMTNQIMSKFYSEEYIEIFNNNDFQNKKFETSQILTAYDININNIDNINNYPYLLQNTCARILEIWFNVDNLNDNIYNNLNDHVKHIIENKANI